MTSPRQVRRGAAGRIFVAQRTTLLASRKIPRTDQGFEGEDLSLAKSLPAASDVRWWALGVALIVLCALMVAALVYVVSDTVSARYQSSAVVRVSVQATGGISDPSVTAANDLASQFAQLASATPVLEAAETTLGPSGGKLSGAVSAGTIAAQNLVRISVTGPSPSSAQARTTALAKAFVAYVSRLDASQAAKYSRAVTSKLRPLDREIAEARKSLLSPNPEVQRNATVLLSTLVSQQQTILGSVAQNAAAAQPSVQLVSPGGSASKVSPKPSLYAAVGFLATLLLLGRLLYVLGTRPSLRPKLAAPPSI